MSLTRPTITEEQDFEGRHWALRYITQHLRPCDQREADLSGWTAELLAHAVATNATRLFIARHQDRATFAYGTYPLTPHSRQVFGFGTVNTPKVIRAVTRHAKTYLIPSEWANGVHRMEVRLPADHIDNIRWLQTIGAKIEGNLDDYGPNREPFVQLRLVKEAAPHVGTA